MRKKWIRKRILFIPLAILTSIVFVACEFATPPLSSPITNSSSADVGETNRFPLKTTSEAPPPLTDFETPPATASKVYDISGYKWRDGMWMKSRKKLCGQRKSLIEIPLRSGGLFTCSSTNVTAALGLVPVWAG